MTAYLAHHLKIAGGTEELFTEKAVTAIQQSSGGLLRRARSPCPRRALVKSAPASALSTSAWPPRRFCDLQIESAACSFKKITAMALIHNKPLPSGLYNKALGCFAFISPHCEYIRNNQNTQAPCERDPNFIANRLTRQERADGSHYRSHGLVFGKGANNRRHRFRWNKRLADKWKEDEWVGKGAHAVHRFRGQSGNRRDPRQSQRKQREDTGHGKP